MLKDLQDLSDINEIAIECGECKAISIINIEQRVVHHCPSCEKDFSQSNNKNMNNIQKELIHIIKTLKFYKKQNHFNIKFIAKHKNCQ